MRFMYHPARNAASGRHPACSPLHQTIPGTTVRMNGTVPQQSSHGVRADDSPPLGCMRYDDTKSHFSMLYDDQATTYDTRAGIPPRVCEAVAEALQEITGFEPGTSILEIGAGTGLFSLPLIERSVRYTGFDRSAPMIAVLREKVTRLGMPAALVVTDGNCGGPPMMRVFPCLLGARPASPRSRPCARGATPRSPRRRRLAGRRAPSPAEQLGEFHDAAPDAAPRGRGRYSGRNHEARIETVFAALEAESGRRAEPRTVAQWTRMHRPVDSLDSWAGKQGLAGLEIPDDTRRTSLRNFAGGQRGSSATSPRRSSRRRASSSWRSM